MRNATSFNAIDSTPHRAGGRRGASPELSRRRGAVAAIIAGAMTLGASDRVGAQSSVCELVPDVDNPPEQILRCEGSLVVRQAEGTTYRLDDDHGARPPSELRLDAGAVMVEFHPSARLPSFQIRTPEAIAAVRGTKWVVEAVPGKTSTFVIAGAVAVSRSPSEPAAILHRGEGVDVAPDSGPIVIKSWPVARVRALLARFGQ